MKSLVLYFTLFFSFGLYAQILKPVSWEFSTNHLANDEYELIFTAAIDSGWAVYSQFVDDGGPLPTTFDFDTNADIERIDNVIETTENKVTKMDPVFEMEVSKFYDKATFIQKVRIKNSNTIVRGVLSFMVCDDTRCLAPEDVPFQFNLGELNDTKSDILEPVTWSFSTKKITDQEYDLIFTAKLDDTWAIASQDSHEEGPLPTYFEFDANKDLKIIDVIKETGTNKVTKKEPLFGHIEVTKYYDDLVYTQRIKLLANDIDFQGFLSYQTCNDEKCLFPIDVPFKLSYANNTLSFVHNKKKEADIDEANTNLQLYGITPNELTKAEIRCNNEVSSLVSDVKKGKSLWTIFGLGFLGGLLALLTPCVFPMIPLTVSFFTKKDNTKKSNGLSKAILYGFFILLVYLILSVPFHLLDSVNPDILNEISTNVILNIIFFLIFMFFAFSFFGYYELTLPASWTSKTTQAENIGGFAGVFFMALTLAIVSFSCTGPILGSLLAGSLTADGGAWQLTAGMGGFGLALGLPFAFFAAFPSWLNSLPKSGGWLNTTKVVLGFLELALAFKFLSNADLVKDWGFLKIEVFLGIWIIIFAGLALYLFGKIKFPHDSPLKKLSFSRISFGILTTAFVIYLASGFRVNKDTNTFNSLTLLSGLAPPVGYSWLLPNKCPNNLDCFKDLKEGVAYAQKINKPIMLDFTGKACVNCRKMEEHVWPKEKIRKHLKDDYVLISLYVDDKTTLPEEEQLTVNTVGGGTRILKNIGHKWAHFQTQFFQINAQPYYVLLSPDGKQILSNPVEYTPDEDVYAQFLQCGLEVFNQSQTNQLSFQTPN